MEQKTIPKRQIAYKTSIKDILEGTYTKEEGDWVPNFVMIGDKKISRANIIGVVVSSDAQENSVYQSITLDDGTGRISVRSFEEHAALGNAAVGDMVMVIGRPREYLDERYLVLEIVKKVDRGWGELRKYELAQSLKMPSMSPESPPIQKEEVTHTIFSLVKEKDSGPGADMQEIINNLARQDAEWLIKKMVAEGELFEVRPGKLKVLE
ncbi:hypothetical protein HYU14_01205 [Candidatus Woesearchaeota archaeon]|nr:hypothetical protein [Candidatus Woesearchaeota archaeon]